MKIIIISDNHGEINNLKKVFEREVDADLMIHLGDFENSEPIIRAKCPCRLEMVAGNNDFFTSELREKVIEVKGHRIFLCHGHMYGVSMGVERIRQEAAGMNCDVVMYGHTHQPFLDEDGVITVLNPGSLNYPRQEDRRCTYMTMNIDNQNHIEYKVKSVHK